MTNVVLDSSAILAILQDEPGQEAVLPVLEGALVSTVNLAEVATCITRYGIPKDVVHTTIAKLPIHPCDFGYDLVALTGTLIQDKRQFGLSLGDRACLALGMMRKIPVLTADKIWKELERSLDIQIQVIR
ncbi:MAG: type II toxin-antitoxin system VapC family toxin [Cyanobacteria bacterium P01_H01_bin.105]